jgi:EpsI family protein
VAIFLGLGLLFAVSGRPVESTVRQKLAEFPMSLDGWEGTTTSLDRDTEKVLAADDYLLANYKSAAAVPMVNLLISYYASQTKGSAMHSPEVCIPAGGWEVSRWGQYDVSLQQLGSTPLPVNRAIIQKGLSRQLVYYWFEQRGRHLTSDYWAKAYTVWDSVSRGRSDGALVRVVTPIDNSDVEAADKRLQDFLNIAFKELPSFVPP